MANFTVKIFGSFVSGTAANDTFNIDANFVTAWGLEGDDTFTCGPTFFDSLTLDGGAGNDSFSFGLNSRLNQVSGGDGNDMVFIASGFGNTVFGGAGNDWIGIGGGLGSRRNVLDAGDGDDFVGATANSTWLLGGTGNDALQVVGDSNALVGGDGNDQVQATGEFQYARGRDRQ